jgi:hypothetical protein
MIRTIRTKAQSVVVAWLAAWPTLTAVLFCLQPFTHDWPLPLRSLASATAMAAYGQPQPSHSAKPLKRTNRPCSQACSVCEK